MKVYVKYDYLTEKIICVHSKPSSKCAKCKKFEDPDLLYPLKVIKKEVKI